MYLRETISKGKRRKTGRNGRKSNGEKGRKERKGKARKREVDSSHIFNPTLSTVTVRPECTVGA